LVRHRSNEIGSLAHLRTCVSTVTVSNMTARNTSALTALQRAILTFIEHNGPVTAEQVREGVKREHPLKDSSVRTLLRRLEGRGLVSHVVEGKTFLYRAEVASTSVAAAAVRRLIDGFWKGSAEQFLTGLVDEKVLSAADLRRLAKKVGGRK
jgi:BlaI family penicillinase repressor